MASGRLTFSSAGEIVHISRFLFQPAKLICLKCGQSYQNRKILIDHYERNHNIQQQFEYLFFSSMDEFENWLSPCYRHTTTWVTKTDTCVLRYRCHRSGMYRDASVRENRARKRRLKVTGSKKLQGFCPGEVTLRQRRNDGLCVVTVQKVHVGHSIEDKDEVLHIYLTRVEKETIARQLMAGVSKEEILQTIYKDFDPNHVKNRRLDTLSSQDIDNVASAFKIKSSAQKTTDPRQVEVFTSERSDSILFYKRHNEPDTRFNIFEMEDFVLVYQTNFQKQVLQKYGHKIVAFDVTHSMNSRDCFLHTMLVLDTENEGFVVAFLISNRYDQAVIEVFVRCIRENAGIIEAKTIMSDMELEYYKAWKAIMGATEFNIYCTWHLRKCWKQKLNELVTISRPSCPLKTDDGAPKLESEDRRRLIINTKQQLFDLANELDMAVFISKLNSFLSTDEPAAKPFLDYFIDNFVNKNNINAWAACCRLNAGINVNARIEAFHRTLKYKIAKQKKVKTLADGLMFIEDYVKYRTSQYLAKVYRPKMSTKLRELHSKHVAAEQDGEKQPFFIDHDANLQLWRVGSLNADSEELSETYFVQKNETKECGQKCMLYCEQCETCFHEFQCSCHDSAVSNNMCKHIHALCISLKHQEMFEEAGTTVVEISEEQDEDDMIIVDVQEEMISENEEEVEKKNAIEEVRESIEKELDRLKDMVKKHMTTENYEEWYSIQQQIRRSIEPMCLEEYESLEIDKKETENKVYIVEHEYQ